MSTPAIRLNSSLPGVGASGLLPFQEDGFEFMRTQDRAAYFYWSTGTGKTLACEFTILWKRQQWEAPGDGGFDLCLYIVKPNNLEGARRKLLEHTGLDGMILDGSVDLRWLVATAAAGAIDTHGQPILIFNAEKFKADKEQLKALVEGTRLLCLFDEMPSKFSNRSTVLYRAAAEVLYTSYAKPSRGRSRGKLVYYPKEGSERAASIFSVITTGTPIYNSPEDSFNTIRLIHPQLMGSVRDFERAHVASRDPWNKVSSWKDLELLAERIKPILHVADKYSDPVIRAQFPEELPPKIEWLELDDSSQRLYKLLENEYRHIATSEVLGYHEIVSAINCLQLICCNPRAVWQSAARHAWYLEDRQVFLASDPSNAHLREWERKHRQGSEVALKLVEMVNDDSRFTDKNAAGECVLPKMLELRRRLAAHGDKAVVFTTMDVMSLRYISEWFDTWDITHITYSGSNNQQARIDAFRNDPDIQVFLSTDAGADSIDLPEANLTINYDLGYTDAGKLQRHNRVSRIDSQMPWVQEVTLVTPFSVEERKLEIISKKRGYTKALFEGELDVEIERTTLDDMLYMLTGQVPE